MQTVKTLPDAQSGLVSVAASLPWGPFHSLPSPHQLSPIITHLSILPSSFPPGYPKEKAYITCDLSFAHTLSERCLSERRIRLRQRVRIATFLVLANRQFHHLSSPHKILKMSANLDKSLDDLVGNRRQTARRRGNRRAAAKAPTVGGVKKSSRAPKAPAKVTHSTPSIPTASSKIIVSGLVSFIPTISFDGDPFTNLLQPSDVSEGNIKVC